MQNGQNQELQCLPKMQIKAIVHEKKKKLIFDVVLK